jgi:hypothetical protein
MSCRCLAALAALALGACAVAPSAAVPQGGAAGLPPISPNRPTFSDGTAVVPPDHLQIETGWTVTQRDQSGTETMRHNVPEVVARYLLTDTFEVRLVWGGYVWTDSETGGATTSDDGGTDVGLAVLVPVVGQDGWRPALVVEAATTLGIGAENLTSGHADPTLKLLWSYGGGRLPDWLSVGGNLIASYPAEAGDRFTQTAASLYAFVSPTGTDTSFYAEWYVVTPLVNNGDEAHTADIGVVQRLSRTTAVDARIGFGLDADADDLFAGLGFSVLF